MESDKQFIRHCIRYEFHQEKSAAKACESICSVLGVNDVSKSTCEFWFRRFKEDDFDVSDRNVVVLLKRLQTMNCKHYSIKTHVKHKTNLHSNLEQLGATCTVTQQDISICLR